MQSSPNEMANNVVVRSAAESVPAMVAKRRSGPRSRTSPYTGVTQYRRTGRWEAHIWVSNLKAKGFQRHLGSYYTAEDAARCYDRAAIRFRGAAAELNFPRAEYDSDEFLQHHLKVDKFRFLDLMRAQFAIPSEKPVPSRRLPRVLEDGPAQEGSSESNAVGDGAVAQHASNGAGWHVALTGAAAQLNGRRHVNGSGRLGGGPAQCVRLAAAQQSAEEDQQLLMTNNPMASALLGDALPFSLQAAANQEGQPAAHSGVPLLPLLGLFQVSTDSVRPARAAAPWEDAQQRGLFSSDGLYSVAGTPGRMSFSDLHRADADHGLLGTYEDKRELDAWLQGTQEAPAQQDGWPHL